MQTPIPPYLLVHTDSSEDGGSASVTLYPLDDRAQGERLAEWLTERDLKSAQSDGGYPGNAWLIDLQNPGDHFTDINELQAEYDEWREENEEN